MENFQLLLDGFATAATPMNLLLALIGVTVGTAVGVSIAGTRWAVYHWILAVKAPGRA